MQETGTSQPIVVESHRQLEIFCDLSEALSFSQVWNRVPFIQELTVQAIDGEPLGTVEIHISMESLGEKVTKPWAISRKVNADEVTLAGPELRIKYDERILIGIEQVQKGELFIEVLIDGQRTGIHTEEIVLLPANVWSMITPLKESTATLASFVNPFDPAIDELITEATPYLKAACVAVNRGEMGNDWSGYQSDADHVDRMVKALYEALCARGIKYIDPPPSWEFGAFKSGNVLNTGGQRIRTPSEVISGGFGTCLDTAVTFAALLEKIGLRPCLILMPGHAQVGYWRNGEKGFSNYITDLRMLINQSLDDLRLIESTCLTKDPPPPFERLDPLARDRIYGVGVFSDDDEVKESFHEREMVLDVALARAIGGISTLPSKNVAPDGTVQLVVPRMQDLTPDDLKRRFAGTDAATQAKVAVDEFPPRVRQWRNSLLDLSLNNPLISLRKSVVRVAVPPGVLGIIEDRLQAGDELELIDQVTKLQYTTHTFAATGVFHDEEAKQILLAHLGQAGQLLVNQQGKAAFRSGMLKLVRDHRNSIEEAGSNDLFLAIGSLDWLAHSSDKPRRVESPLFLIPITIRASNKSREFRIKIDSSNDVVPNFSLLEKLDRDYNFQLPKLMNPDTDDFGIDIEATIRYVRERIASEGLDFIVHESACIGTFEFSTYRLWRDLTDNWQKFEENSFVKHLIYTPNQEFTGNSDVPVDVSPDLDDLAATLPIPVDGTQAQAIHDALSGKSLIIEGPPGTGKSQTISNLLIKAVHEGKRVLFVAEKQAAVDVVVERLTAINMDSFFLDLHNEKSKPEAVRAQLRSALERTAAPDTAGMVTSKGKLQQSVTPLKSLPSRIHARGRFGESAYSAQDLLVALGDGPELELKGQFLSSQAPEDIQELLSKLDTIAATGSSAGNAQQNRWSLSTITSPNFSEDVRSAIRVAVTAIHNVTSAPSAAVTKLFESLTAAELSGLESLLSAVPPSRDVIEVHQSAEFRQKYETLVNALSQLDAAVASSGFVGATTIDMPLSLLEAELQVAQNSFAIGRKGKVNAVLAKVNSFLATPVGNAVVLQQQILPNVKQIIDYAKYTRTLVNDVAGVSVGPLWNPLDAKDRSEFASQKARIDEWVALLDGSSPHSVALRAFVETWTSQEWDQIVVIASQFNALNRILGADEHSVRLWSGDQPLGARFFTDVEAWFSDVEFTGFSLLNQWTILFTLVSPLVLGGARWAGHQILSENVPFYQASQAFRRSYLRQVRDWQISQEGLANFDGDQHDRAITEFGKALNDVRTFIPETYAAAIIQTRGFDSLTSVGNVGRLKKELNKVKQVLPVRKLLKENWQVVTRITPCIFASPSSVALFLDPSVEPFDLVIFDEASQIKTPHAIGAIGRAKAAVIVGDSRQMPPSSNFSVKGAEIDELDDESVDLVTDEESILSEAVVSMLPQTWLSWHYRSEDESLIAFSNDRYYDGKLSSFPSPSTSRTTKGVSFVRVDGHFYRPSTAENNEPTIDPESGGKVKIGTNPIEARAIVQEIVRRVNDPEDGSSSILVVSLNSQQAALISELLADVDDDKVQEALSGSVDEKILVKALEQVQGSERDVVLMSISFSRNGKGVLPGNFGPMNKENGHRRLNVAITRARRQVIVYCSFDPAELVGKSQSRGIVDLQSFLANAKDGGSSEWTGAVLDNSLDRHRDAIASRLVDRGLNVEKQVGASDFKLDIVVTHPDDPSKRILGILLDNRPWYRRRTVIDRDLLPPSVLLNKMGWTAISRVWLPMWFKNPEAEIDKIEALVRSIIDGTYDAGPGTHDNTPTPSVASRILDSVVMEATRIAPIVEPATSTEEITFWKPCVVQVVGSTEWLDQVHVNPQVRQRVGEVLATVVQSEAPISGDRAAKLVGNCFDLSVVKEKRKRDILSIPLSGVTVDAEGFFFLENQDLRSGWRSWRANGPDHKRDVKEIALGELVNGMVHIATKGLGIARDELPRETAVLFGFQKLTEPVRTRMLAALDFGVAQGVLVVDGDFVNVG